VIRLANAKKSPPKDLFSSEALVLMMTR